MLLVRPLDEHSVCPEIRGQVAIRLSESEEGCLDEVTHRTGLSGCARVGIVDAGKGKHALGGRRSD